jgi:hypothetical protein
MTETRRTTVSELAKLLADRKTGGTSSVTIKTSAQGQFMPEVTVVAGEDPKAVAVMVKQATDAYTALLKAGK